MTGRFGYPYFANFINSDMKPEDSRSMCPMTSDTKVIVKSNENDVRIANIRDIYDDYIQYGTLYDVWTPDGWQKGKPNRTEKTKVLKITLSNGQKIKFGINHLQPVKDFGTLKASELSVGMKIPFDKNYPQNHGLRLYCCEDDKFNYFTIIKIEEYNYNENYLYCFEIDNEDHLLTLANGMITHNCRLRLDLTELQKRNGGLFGSGDSTGSIGVVTINLPRIAYRFKNNKQGFFKELERVLNIAKESLEIKRKWLQKNVIETNLIPAFNTYVGTMRNHFSTIGIIGMNEMCENFMDKDILTDEGRDLSLEVGNFIRSKLIDFQKETGNLYNFEATPAESTTFRLAKKDKKDYPDIITRGTENAPYYTNSCHIPVSKIKGIKETFEHQENLQILFTGGTVIHIYTSSAISADSAKSIVQAVCRQYKVPYISISPISRYCSKHGYIPDNVDICPICDEQLQKYQRITGYVRCIDNFNEGKKSEFNERVQLNIEY